MDDQTRFEATDPRFKRAWATGEFGVPVDRYIDRDFAELERDRLWPKVWQMACRLDEIPQQGSYTVYEILDESIVVVRVDENVVKAYHNVCPHRATALAVGSGRFQLKSIVCPFHGWRWNLEGENTHVLDRSEFMDGCLSDEQLRLKECRVAIWMGSVWINMDPDAPSFDEHIAPIKALIDPLLIDKMKFYWHKSIVLPANWKVAQEAFFESYHVPQTHPQLLLGRLQGEDYTREVEYTAFPNGHGIFSSGKMSASVGRLTPEQARNVSKEDQVRNLVHNLKLSFEGMDAMVLKEEIELAQSMADRDVPEGVLVGVEFQRVLRDHYRSQGRPIADFEALQAVTDCHIFPNITFLPSFGNILLYRARPSKNNNPDECIFELYSLRTYPEDQPSPAWVTEYCTDSMDSEQYRLIPRQDFGNIPRQQRGMHSRAMRSTLLSGRQEKMIRNMHVELDRYLKAPGDA